MKLSQLLPILRPLGVGRSAYADLEQTEISAIVNDSRRAVPGCMFVALRGLQADGHSFIPNALRSGAAAIVSERPVQLDPAGRVAHFVLPDARRKLSALAAAFYGDPTARLHVTGITGTNGKTTTSHRLRSILEAAGRRTGTIGTIAYKIADRIVPARNTTPGSLLLQHLFAQMVAEHLTHSVVEVSSHALDLHRVCDVKFDVAVFTGLADREHLDYHGTFERYRDAKARLFEMLGPDAVAVINADDPLGQYMADRAGCRKLWFGINNKADVTARIEAMDLDGTRYRLVVPEGAAEIRSVFVGEFNVMNDLAAAACAHAAGVGLQEIVNGLQSTSPVPGRLERIPGPDFYPLVDYAHNEGALECVLGTLRKLAHKRLIIVLGCGGDRDRSKRPAMGAVAEKYCDLIFLTADNSRSEETARIISEIELGMAGSRPRCAVHDREMAIRAAADAAEPGDVLLVTGKGHETYQILGQTKIPFDDREVLRSAIAERTAAQQHLVR